MTREQDEQTRVFYYLSSMIINLLGSPPLPIPFPFPTTFFASSPATLSQPSPTAFASLFLGLSLALMLFGSAIFVIGFVLMPWIIALVLLFYLAEMAANLSDLVRAVVYSVTKDVPALKL